MGVAALVFEPHPSYLGKMHIFWSFINGITVIFTYLLWFTTYKIPRGVCNPGNFSNPWFRNPSLKFKGFVRTHAKAATSPYFNKMSVKAAVAQR